MKDRFDKLDMQIEMLDKRIDSIDITLAVQSELLRTQSESLIEHMKRTEASEQRLAHLELSWERHLAYVEGSLKVLKSLGWSIGIFWTLAQISVLIFTYAN